MAGQSKNFKIAITILILAPGSFCVFSAVFKYLLGRDEGYKRFQKCKQIHSRISREELITKLGHPYLTQKTQNGNVYYYHEAMFAAGPIRLMLDSNESTLIGTKCSEDGRWTYFE